MKNLRVRFGNWLNDAHPVIRVPIKILMTILFGAKFLSWKGGNFFLWSLYKIGTLFILLSFFLLILWVFRMNIGFLEIVQIYLLGQGLKLTAWIPGALLRLWRWSP